MGGGGLIKHVKVRYIVVELHIIWCVTLVIIVM